MAYFSGYFKYLRIKILCQIYVCISICTYLYTYTNIYVCMYVFEIIPSLNENQFKMTLVYKGEK